MGLSRQTAFYFFKNFIMTFFLQLCISFYRLFLSPLLHVLCGGSCGCRFFPSCSHYCGEALKKYGPRHGLRLSLARLARCHPWNAGGYDPVPTPTNSTLSLL